jgi:hypothetical protein
MDQSTLNNTRIDEWEEQGLYKEVFRLKLTSKHELVVGKWIYGDSWGVDLRRWSYDHARLLGEGITLNSSTWEWLIGEIITRYDSGLFSSSDTYTANYPRFRKKVDREFSIGTEYFYSNNGYSYLCINLFDNKNRQIWRGQHARIGTMIRIDTIHDLIVLCRSKGLVELSQDNDKSGQQIDPRTGKKVF